MNENSTNAKKRALGKRGVLNIIGIILCVILIPVLIINCILIVRGITNKNEVPSISGNAPLIVLTESMDPNIKAGDLIICKLADADEVAVGDVISFFDPEGNGSSIVTHRVIRIETDALTGEKYFRTQGDNNDIMDRSPVPAENLVGKWEGTRIPALGRIILFVQSAAGMITILLLIVAAVALYMIMSKRTQDKEKQSDIDALKAEIEALKAAQNGGADAQDTDGGKDSGR